MSSPVVNITYEKQFDAAVYAFADDKTAEKVKKTVDIMKTMTKPPKKSAQSVVSDDKGTKFAITFKP